MLVIALTAFFIPTPKRIIKNVYDANLSISFYETWYVARQTFCIENSRVRRFAAEGYFNILGTNKATNLQFSSFVNTVSYHL